MTSLDEKGTLSIESDQLGSRFRGNPGLRNLVSETVGDQWNAAYGGLSRTHLDTATCGTELQNSSVTRGGDGDRVRPPGGYHTAGIAPPAGPVQFGSAVDAVAAGWQQVYNVFRV